MCTVRAWTDQAAAKCLPYNATQARRHDADYNRSGGKWLALHELKARWNPNASVHAEKPRQAYCDRPRNRNPESQLKPCLWFDSE